MERPSEQPTPDDTPEPSDGDREPAIGEISEEPAHEPDPTVADAERVEAPPEVETQPSEEPPERPWGIPQPGPAPTAEGMTARGAMFLSEGRLQEAIDQFTKAIALDPRHREAFEGRAEAYSKQGRGERAEQDYQSLRILNAGS